MIPYTVAADRAALAQNNGTEVMASSPLEAAEKYFAIGEPVGYESDQDFMASVWVRHPDGALTEIEAEPDVHILGFPEDDDDDKVMVCCPEYGHNFDCTAE